MTPLPEQSLVATSNRWPRQALVAAVGLVGVHALLACVLLVWVNQTVFDPTRFGNAVEETLNVPEVTDQLAVFVTDQIVNTVDLDRRISDLIPGETKLVETLLAETVKSTLRDRLARALSSDVVIEGVTRAAELSHEQLIRVLKGEPLVRGVAIDGDAVTLDLLPLISQGLSLLAEFDGFGEFASIDVSSIVERTDAINRIEQLTDRQLPDDFGQIVVFRSDSVAEAGNAVATAQKLVELFQQFRVFVVMVAIITLAAAVYFSRDRRRACVWIFFGIGASCLLLRTSISYGISESTTLLNTIGGQLAIETMLTSLTADLMRTYLIILYVSAFIAAGLVVLDNKPAVEALRQRIEILKSGPVTTPDVAASTNQTEEADDSLKTN